MKRAAQYVGAMLLLLALPVWAEPAHGTLKGRKNVDGSGTRFLWRAGFNQVAAAEECTGNWPSNFFDTAQGLTAPPVTVTRAASKYCTRSDGVLVLVTSNKPAVSSAGLRVDANTTSNRIFPSEQFNTWTATNATVSADAVVAPNLATTAERVDVTADGGKLVSGDFTPTGATGRLSLYAKTASPGQSFTMQLELVDQVTTGTAMTCSLTVNKNTWEQYVCSSGTITNPSNAHKLHLYPVGLTGTGTVDIWGVMHAPAAPHQTYIPTTAAAATVAGENLSVTTPVWMPIAAGAALFEVAHAAGATSAISVDGRNATDGYALLVSRSSTAVTPQFSVRASSVTTTTSGTAVTVASASTTTLRWEWGGTTLRMSVGGASNYASSAITMPATVATSMTFGTFGSSTGWIKRFCVDSVMNGCQ